MHKSPNILTKTVALVGLVAGSFAACSITKTDMVNTCPALPKKTSTAQTVIAAAGAAPTACTPSHVETPTDILRTMPNGYVRYVLNLSADQAVSL